MAPLDFDDLAGEKDEPKCTVLSVFVDEPRVPNGDADDFESAANPEAAKAALEVWEVWSFRA